MSDKRMTFDEKELIFLAAWQGEGRLIGIEDPFSGWLADMVSEEWKRQLPSILAKGYLTPDTDSGYRLSSSIDSIVRLCCSPSRWIMARLVNPREKQIHVFTDYESSAAVIMSYEKPSVFVTCYSEVREESFKNDFIARVGLNRSDGLLPEAFCLEVERTAFEEFSEQAGRLEDSRLGEHACRYFKGIDELSNVCCLLCRPENKVLLTRFSLTDEDYSMELLGLYSGPGGILKLEDFERSGKAHIRISPTNPDEILKYAIDRK